MKLGNIIKEIQYQSDLTQKEIAEIIGCRQSTISEISTNSSVPRLATLVKLIKLANKYKIKVTLEQLLSGI